MFSIFKPPSFIFLNTVSLFTLSGLCCQRKLKTISFNSLIMLFEGLGSEIKRWLNLDIRRVFITVIRPTGVRSLFSHCFRVFVLAAIFLLKLISQILLKSTSNSIPSNLNDDLPQMRSQFWHSFLLEYFLLPIQITWVLSKLTFKPDILSNHFNSFKEALSDCTDPSNIREVSSAYCETLYSYLSIIIPLICLLFLILIAKISAHSRNKYGEIGSPCL